MLNSVPVQTPLLGANGLITPEWATFFQKVVRGDVGQEWTPTYSGLTVVGSITHTGKWFELTRYQAYFTATVTSSGGGTSASVAGTTYINNFPKTIQGDGVILAANSTTLLGIGTGLVKASNSRIYPPSWIATTDTITISGIIETR